MKQEYSAPELFELDASKTLNGGNSLLQEEDFPNLPPGDAAFPNLS